MRKCISVLGCGRLGLPLAKMLLRHNYRVKGSTTTPGKVNSLQKEGIEAFQLGFTPDAEASGDVLTHFFDTDVLVINIPPKARRNPKAGKLYPVKAETIAGFISPRTEKVIFVSSTSVYPNTNTSLDESFVIENSPAPYILQAEEVFSNSPGPKSFIVRAGGLMGSGNFVQRFISGKKEMRGGDSPVNFVHTDDVNRLILELIKQDAEGGVYNAVAPEHPQRTVLYTEKCKALGLEVPTFTEDELPWKIIESGKAVRELGFRFKFPDPMNFDL